MRCGLLSLLVLQSGCWGGALLATGGLLVLRWMQYRQRRATIRAKSGEQDNSRRVHAQFQYLHKLAPVYKHR